MDNTQRIQNLLLGKHAAETTIHIGYEPNNSKHKEGDIWEENGKTWTIKNGITQNVTRYDVFREEIVIPFSCPKCGNPLLHDMDKRTYMAEKRCLNCSVTEESLMKANGTWFDYIKEKNSKNRESYLGDIKLWIDTYIENFSNTNYVSGDGISEDWEPSTTKEKIKEVLYKRFDEFKQYLENTQN